EEGRKQGDAESGQTAAALVGKIGRRQSDLLSRETCKVRKQSAESNPLVIRPAQLEDAVAITALIHRAFEQYRGRLSPESGALSETVESIRAAMDGGTILVAVTGERIGGCVSVRRKADFAYAARLAVDPAMRGQGVGRALVAAAEAVARRLKT